MTNEIDNIIDDAAAQDATVETVKQVADTPIEDETPESIEEDVPFPKKAVNALSRKDKKIGSLTAKYQAEAQARKALEERLAAYEAKQAPKSKTGEPDINDFEDLQSYSKALARYEAKQLLDEDRKTQQETLKSTQAQQYIAQREEAVAAKAQEYITSIPDYEQVLQENSDILDDVPRHIENLFLEAEDGALAFYNLAKEGKLESLLTMTPAQAALAIARAEAKGVAAKTNVSSAPKPMQPNKGSAAGAKSLDNASGDEVRAWLKS